MARRRYYYRRISRPKQKWAINTVEANVSTNASLTVSPGAFGTIGVNVCINSSRIDASAASLISSAQILKTGRWKVKGVIPTATTAVSYIFYLVYVPEGYYSSNISYTISSDDGSDIFYRHPEWVLTWTRKDYDASAQSNEVSLTSRLKRNLNTGDAIQLRVLIYNNSGSAFTIGSGVPLLRGTVSYCCRAN